MNTYKIYKNNSEVPGDYMATYEAEEMQDSSAYRSHLEVSPNAFHYLMPEGEVAEDCDPVLIPDTWSKEGEEDVTVDPEDPSWTLIPEHYALQLNQTKKDARIVVEREAKLEILRAQRVVKFSEADVELLKHYDGDANIVGTEADWKAYRVNLRNVTDSYKEHSSDSAHATAIDAEDADWASFTWPTKPS